MAKTLTFYQVEGLSRALRALPRTASARLRDASQEIASRVASDAAARASAQGGAAAKVAPSIRAGRDRVPLVRMGNSSPIRSGPRQTIGDLIWGAEFGGGARPTTRQFRPWKGSGTGAGYFLWPTVRDDRSFIETAYGDALLDAIDEAAR